jgi:hypothetical protein
VGIVRGLALKVNAGKERCWIQELAWEENGELLTEPSRVVGWCDQPPAIIIHGSGICVDHAPLFLERRCGN